MVKNLPVTLKIIERYARIFKNQRLDKLGLSSRQAEILLSVLNHPGSSQEELADRLLIPKSGITRQLTAMEEAGLVTRSVSPTDRRVTKVELTEKAQPLVPEIRQVNRQWAEFLTEGMTQQEQELLIRMLENVRRRIHACLEKGE